MRRVGAVATLAGLGAIAASLALPPRSTTVAVVDGVVISREAYDEYARVFTAPDGSLRVSAEDVLLSLVNQVLVQREADRRGLAVAEEDLAALIEEMNEPELAALSLPGRIASTRRLSSEFGCFSCSGSSRQTSSDT